MEIGRPSTKSQPSRKGKKAWRKNIDIDEVEEGLENAREIERTVGTTAPTSEDLFTVDVQGDEKLLTRKERAAKPLKSTEILARRSAVPAVVTRLKKNDASKKQEKGVQGVSGKEINRLMQTAGRLAGVSSSKAGYDKHGVNKGETYDLWGSPSETKPKVQDKSFLKEAQVASSFQNATIKPKTMEMAPISFLSDDIVEAIPEGGKSYNPDHEEWLELLRAEHAREEVRESERLKLEEERARIEELIRNLPDNEIADSDSESDSGSSSDEEAYTGAAALSVNAPVQNKKKSQQQRRKQKRHQARMDLQDQVKRLKQQIRDLNQLPKLLEAQIEELEKLQPESEKTGIKRKKKLGKYAIKEAPLEIKLSDELESTLRRLKPEGNRAADQFRQLQTKGLVEARVPVAKRRRYVQKVTEKWTYKDYK